MFDKFSRNKIYPYLLVFLQILLIGLLFINSDLAAQSLIPLAIVVSGAGLGAWAFFVMRKSKFRVTPQVAQGAKLIKDGPYKIIRHPMYSAVLLACLGFLVSNTTILNLGFYILLFFVLILKIKYEEKELEEAFPEYKVYSSQTKRLMPFVF